MFLSVAVSSAEVASSRSSSLGDLRGVSMRKNCGYNNNVGKLRISTLLCDFIETQGSRIPINTGFHQTKPT